MSTPQFIFVILTVICLSVGQVLFKVASSSVELSLNGFLKSLFNTKLFIALVVYMLATMMWLLVLKETPLRVAYPFAALAFFVVPILAHFLLGETLGWNTFAGGALIALGVWVSTYK